MGPSPGLVKPDERTRIVCDASHQLSGVVAGVVNQPAPPNVGESLERLATN